MNARPLSIFLLVAVCLSGIPSGAAEAQAKVNPWDFTIAPAGEGTERSFILDPGSLSVFETMMRGKQIDGEIAVQPRGPGQNNGGLVFRCGPLGAGPVIGNQRVGFLNATAAAVKFTIEGGGTSVVHELVAHEVMTVEMADGASFQATVSTQDHDETVTLEQGVLYRLRGEGQRWIFARD